MLANGCSLIDFLDVAPGQIWKRLGLFSATWRSFGSILVCPGGVLERLGGTVEYILVCNYILSSQATVGTCWIITAAASESSLATVGTCWITTAAASESRETYVI